MLLKRNRSHREADERVLITGGAGYVGAHVNKCLSERGYRTVVLDNLQRGHRDLVRWGEFIEGRVGDKGLLKKIFQRYSITSVIHLAAFAYVGESVEKPGKYWKNNFSESLSLLDQCVMFGVKRLILSSTCSIYGQPATALIDEDHRQAPINPYGRTKLALEWAIEDITSASDLTYCSLRYFNAAGADPNGEIGERHSPETHLIPLALRAAFNNGGEIEVYGGDYDTPDGTCIRDYVHVCDLADAHARALKYLEDSGQNEKWNLGLGSGFSVNDVLESVERVSGQSIKRIVKPRRAGDPPLLVSDPSRARQMLGWNPKFLDLDSIIDTAWSWHQKEWNE
jgi:UDP-glucose 4-epimerase